MKTAKIAGIWVVALMLAPSVFGPLESHALAQGLQNEPLARADRGLRDLMVLAGRGAEIGVRIAESTGPGVVIEEVQPDSPAERAGLKRSDVLVEFDGEHVRGARQFVRLVQETPPGRAVKATILRDGQKKDIQITPAAGRGAGLTIDGGRLRERLGDLGTLGDRLPPFDFHFDVDPSGALSGRRLGVNVDELTDQLAQYFGVSDGVLVTSVTDGSAASRAGLKAGDIITSIDGQPVRSHGDLVRALGEPGSRDEVAIGIVRDKKASTVQAKLDAPRRSLRGARPA
jgi:serine protease Do